ncbi:MAG: hypothetical protein ACREQ5_07545 [Candidatus Dormibacteria bacterium]
MRSHKPNLVETKSLLAKLLAGENITVLHENISTGYFDLRQRELHCPMWKDMSGVIYDLLMAHEVSHGLHTPAEGWHQAIFKCPDCLAHRKNHKPVQSCVDLNFKNFINICEDARIERLIKEAYPGLQARFAKAYQELYDRDMFGIKGLADPNRLPLIDRVNLYFKFGSIMALKFSADEQPYIDRLARAETWDQTLAVARELFAKQKEEQQPENQKDDDINTAEQLQKAIKQDQEQRQQEKSEQHQTGEPEESESDESDSDEGEDTDGKPEGESDEESESDESDSDEGEDADGKPEGESDEESESDKESESDSAQASRENDQQPPYSKDPVSTDSLTDKAFREAEKDMLENIDGAIANITLPSANLKDIIIPLDEVVSSYENSKRMFFANTNDARQYDASAAAALTIFQKKNKAYVNLLVKEFEMRKNARQYLRAQTSRSGELDMRRLSQYKFTNDVFRRITEAPKGKSHGMVMFLDMSDSMSGSYTRLAVEQIITLATFCNKLAIPYDIYGFANAPYNQKKSRNKFSRGHRDLDLDKSYHGDGSFHLRTLLSSSVSSGLQRRAMRMMAFFSASHINNPTDPLDADLSALCKSESHDNILVLHSTPLVETIVASRPIIDQFKQTHHNDIVNVIYLTDGDGDGINMPCVVVDEMQRLKKWVLEAVVVKDPVTKQQLSTLNTKKPWRPGRASRDDTIMVQDIMMEMVSEVTGCRHLGYFIGDSSALRARLTKRFAPDSPVHQKASKSLAKEGFAAVPMGGFHNYYLVNSENMAANTTINVEAVSDANFSPKDLSKFISNSQFDKKRARTILSKFAQEIATQDDMEVVE